MVFIVAVLLMDLLPAYGSSELSLLAKLAVYTSLLHESYIHAIRHQGSIHMAAQDRPCSTGEWHGQLSNIGVSIPHRADTAIQRLIDAQCLLTRLSLSLRST